MTFIILPLRNLYIYLLLILIAISGSYLRLLLLLLLTAITAGLINLHFQDQILELMFLLFLAGLS